MTPQEPLYKTIRVKVEISIDDAPCGSFESVEDRVLIGLLIPKTPEAYSRWMLGFVNENFPHAMSTAMKNAGLFGERE